MRGHGTQDDRHDRGMTLMLVLNYENFVCGVCMMPRLHASPPPQSKNAGELIPLNFHAGVSACVRVYVCVCTCTCALCDGLPPCPGCPLPCSYWDGLQSHCTAGQEGKLLWMRDAWIPASHVQTHAADSHAHVSENFFVWVWFLLWFITLLHSTNLPSDFVHYFFGCLVMLFSCACLTHLIFFPSRRNACHVSLSSQVQFLFAGNPFRLKFK